MATASGCLGSAGGNHTIAGALDAREKRTDGNQDEYANAAGKHTLVSR